MRFTYTQEHIEKATLKALQCRQKLDTLLRQLVFLSTQEPGTGYQTCLLIYRDGYEVQELADATQELTDYFGPLEDDEDAEE